MAVTTKTVNSLRLSYEDDLGDSMSISYSGIKANPDVSKIKALSDTLIANNEAFEHAPTTLNGASVVTTETKHYEPSDLVI